MGRVGGAGMGAICGCAFYAVFSASTGSFVWKVALGA
jgi:hypothetical protein